MEVSADTVPVLEHAEPGFVVLRPHELQGEGCLSRKAFRLS